MSRVALIGENSIGYVDTLIKIWNNMDCAVLLDWRIPFSTAIEMMIEADVHTCFIEKGIFNKLENEIPDSINFVTYEKQNSSAVLLPSYIYEKFHENYSRSEAAVIYSSGTTGKSKGIILSHFAINTNADAIIDYMKPTSEDCIYIAKTLSHSSTLTGELLVALKTKMKLVIAPIIVPPRYILNNIKKFSVTMICINPTLQNLLMTELNQNNKYDISSLHNIYVHGAKAARNNCELAKKIFSTSSVHYEYGLSEAGPRVATQKLGAKQIDSVGKPILGVEVAVINEHEKVVDKERRGIIHVKTPSIYKGYIKGSYKFKSLYKGWLNTGDIGYWDEYGELHIDGRIDDMINIDAHKIHPNDIEQHIINIMKVKECVVMKVQIDGKDTIGCLYVSNELITGASKKVLSSILMVYETPKIYIKVDKLPRTMNGKISRVEAEKIMFAILNTNFPK